MFRELVLASRPLSWVNTAFPFGAAYLLAGGEVDVVFLVGVLHFLIPYNLLMYGINDVFDFESDMRNPRKGGVEGSVLPPEHHRRLALTALIAYAPGLVWLCWAGHWAGGALLLVSTFFVIAYSVPGLRFKEVPVLDSVTSSLHFSTPAWVALGVLGTWPSLDGWLTLIAFFLWGAASQAFGAVQDIVPDRESGIASVATVLGARTTVRAATAVYVVAGAFVGLTGWPTLLAGALVLPYAFNAGRFWWLADDESESANSGWKAFLWLNYVVGFLVTLMMIWVVLDRA